MRIARCRIVIIQVKNMEKDLTLKYPIMTRVDQPTHKKLKDLAAKNPDESIAGVVRKILSNQPVKIYTHDETTDLLLEELTAIRGELRHIGVNFNQITRQFNSVKQPGSKQLYAKLGLQQYVAIEPKVELLLAIISSMSEKWLSG